MGKIKQLSEYCLNCKTKPCQKACPLGNDIPEFIKNIKEENYEEAYKVLSKTTVLESICGRICPHMSQCMGSCVRGIKSEPVSIGELEAFVGDLAIKNNFEMDYNIFENSIDNNLENGIERNAEKNTDASIQENAEINKKNNAKKIAIIGSGPAGLTCAAFLARKGFNVTIYEKHEKLGGILRHGIPEFRLDKNILDNTIQKILDLGINVKYNIELGVDISLQELTNQYDSVFIAIGANIPWKMGIEGEELKGVYGGNSLLENSTYSEYSEIENSTYSKCKKNENFKNSEYNKTKNSKTHPDYTGKSVAIIGGGNVAMDCARTINKMGAKKVTVIYRRAEEQMPAERKEIEDAKSEGVEFLFQTNIIKILGEDKVEKIECIKTQLVQKEGDSRLSPVDIENSNFQLDMDYVVMAIGAIVEDEIVNSLGLEYDRKGYIKVNENFETSMKNVYAGGDVAGVKATVAWAARSGRDVAEIIARDN